MTTFVPYPHRLYIELPSSLQVSKDSEHIIPSAEWNIFVYQSITREESHPSSFYSSSFSSARSVQPSVVGGSDGTLENIVTHIKVPLNTPLLQNKVEMVSDPRIIIVPLPSQSSLHKNPSYTVRIQLLSSFSSAFPTASTSSSIIGGHDIELTCFLHYPSKSSNHSSPSSPSSNCLRIDCLADTVVQSSLSFGTPTPYGLPFIMVTGNFGFTFIPNSYLIPPHIRTLIAPVINPNSTGSRLLYVSVEDILSLVSSSTPSSSSTPPCICTENYTRVPEGRNSKCLHRLTSSSSSPSSNPFITGQLVSSLHSLNIMVTLSRGTGELLMHPVSLGNIICNSSSSSSSPSTILSVCNFTGTESTGIPSQSLSSSISSSATYPPIRPSPSSLSFTESSAWTFQSKNTATSPTIPVNMDALVAQYCQNSGQEDTDLSDIHLLFYILNEVSSVSPSSRSPSSSQKRIIGFSYLRLFDNYGHFLTHPSCTLPSTKYLSIPNSLSSSKLPYQLTFACPLTLYPGSPPFLLADNDGQPLYLPSPTTRNIETDIYDNRMDSSDTISALDIPSHLRLLTPVNTAVVEPTNHANRWNITDVSLAQATGIFPTAFTYRITIVDTHSNDYCIGDSDIRTFIRTHSIPKMSLSLRSSINQSSVARNDYAVDSTLTNQIFFDNLLLSKVPLSSLMEWNPVVSVLIQYVANMYMENMGRLPQLKNSSSFSLSLQGLDMKEDDYDIHPLLLHTWNFYSTAGINQYILKPISAKHNGYSSEYSGVYQSLYFSIRSLGRSLSLGILGGTPVPQSIDDALWGKRDMQLYRPGSIPPGMVETSLSLCRNLYLSLLSELKILRLPVINGINNSVHLPLQLLTPFRKSYDTRVPSLTSLSGPSVVYYYIHTLSQVVSVLQDWSGVLFAILRYVSRTDHFYGVLHESTVFTQSNSVTDWSKRVSSISTFVKNPLLHTLVSLRTLLVNVIDTMYVYRSIHSSLISSSSVNSILGMEIVDQFQNYFYFVTVLVKQFVNISASLPYLTSHTTWFSSLLSQLVIIYFNDNQHASCVLGKAAISSIPQELTETSVLSVSSPESVPSTIRTLMNVNVNDNNTFVSETNNPSEPNNSSLLPNTKTSFIDKYRKTVQAVGSHLSGNPFVLDTTTHAAVSSSIVPSSNTLDIQNTVSVNLRKLTIDPKILSVPPVVSKDTTNASRSNESPAVMIPPPKVPAVPQVSGYVQLHPKGFLGDGAVTRSPLPAISAFNDQLLSGYSVALRSSLLEMALELLKHHQRTPNPLLLHKDVYEVLCKYILQEFTVILDTVAKEDYPVQSPFFDVYRLVLPNVEVIIDHFPNFSYRLLAPLWRTLALLSQRCIKTYQSITVANESKMDYAFRFALSTSCRLLLTVLRLQNSLAIKQQDEISVDYTADIIQACSAVLTNRTADIVDLWGDIILFSHRHGSLLRSKWKSFLSYVMNQFTIGTTETRENRLRLYRTQLDTMDECDEPTDGFIEFINAFNESFSLSYSSVVRSDTVPLSPVYPLPIPIELGLGSSCLTQLLSLISVANSSSSGGGTLGTQASVSVPSLNILLSAWSMVNTNNELDTAMQKLLSPLSTRDQFQALIGFSNICRTLLATDKSSVSSLAIQQSTIVWKLLPLVLRPILDTISTVSVNDGSSSNPRIPFVPTSQLIVSLRLVCSFSLTLLQRITSIWDKKALLLNNVSRFAVKETFVVFREVFFAIVRTDTILESNRSNYRETWNQLVDYHGHVPTNVKDVSTVPTGKDSLQEMELLFGKPCVFTPVSSTVSLIVNTFLGWSASLCLLFIDSEGKTEETSVLTSMVQILSLYPTIASIGSTTVESVQLMFQSLRTILTHPRILPASLETVVNILVTECLDTPGMDPYTVFPTVTDALRCIIDLTESFSHLSFPFTSLLVWLQGSQVYPLLRVPLTPDSLPSYSSQLDSAESSYDVRCTAYALVQRAMCLLTLYVDNHYTLPLSVRSSLLVPRILKTLPIHNLSRTSTPYVQLLDSLVLYNVCGIALNASMNILDFEATNDIITALLNVMTTVQSVLTATLTSLPTVVSVEKSKVLPATVPPKPTKPKVTFKETPIILGPMKPVLASDSFNDASLLPQNTTDRRTNRATTVRYVNPPPVVSPSKPVLQEKEETYEESSSMDEPEERNSSSLAPVDDNLGYISLIITDLRLGYVAVNTYLRNQAIPLLGDQSKWQDTLQSIQRFKETIYAKQSSTDTIEDTIRTLVPLYSSFELGFCSRILRSLLPNFPNGFPLVPHPVYVIIGMVYPTVHRQYRWQWTLIPLPIDLSIDKFLVQLQCQYPRALLFGDDTPVCVADTGTKAKEQYHFWGTGSVASALCGNYDIMNLSRSQSPVHGPNPVHIYVYPAYRVTDHSSSSVTQITFRTFITRGMTIRLPSSSDFAKEPSVPKPSITMHPLRSAGPVLHNGNFKLHRDVPDRNVMDENVSSVLCLDVQPYSYRFDNNNDNHSGVSKYVWKTRSVPCKVSTFIPYPLLMACNEWLMHMETRLQVLDQWSTRSIVTRITPPEMEEIKQVEAPSFYPSYVPKDLYDNPNVANDGTNDPPTLIGDIFPPNLIRQLLTGKGLNIQHRPVTLSTSILNTLQPTVSNTGIPTTTTVSLPLPTQNTVSSKSQSVTRSVQPVKSGSNTVQSRSTSARKPTDLPPPSFVFGVPPQDQAIVEHYANDVPDSDSDDDEHSQLSRTNTVSRVRPSESMDSTNSFDTDVTDNGSSIDDKDSVTMHDETLSGSSSAATSPTDGTITLVKPVWSNVPPIAWIRSTDSSTDNKNNNDSNNTHTSHPNDQSVQLSTLTEGNLQARFLSTVLYPSHGIHSLIEGAFFITHIPRIGLSKLSQNLLSSARIALPDSLQDLTNLKTHFLKGDMGMITAAMDYQPCVDAGSLYVLSSSASSVTGNPNNNGGSPFSSVFIHPSVPPTVSTTVSSLYLRNVLIAGQLNNYINISMYPSVNSRWNYATSWTTALAALADYAELKIVERERTTTELRREYCRWEAQQVEKGVNVDTLPLPDWTTRVPRLLHPTPILLEHKLLTNLSLVSRIQTKVQYTSLLYNILQSMNSYRGTTTALTMDSSPYRNNNNNNVRRTYGNDGTHLTDDGNDCIM